MPNILGSASPAGRCQSALQHSRPNLVFWVGQPWSCGTSQPYLGRCEWQHCRLGSRLQASAQLPVYEPTEIQRHSTRRNTDRRRKASTNSAELVAVADEQSLGDNTRERRRRRTADRSQHLALSQNSHLQWSSASDDSAAGATPANDHVDVSVRLADLGARIETESKPGPSAKPAKWLTHTKLAKPSVHSAGPPDAGDILQPERLSNPSAVDPSAGSTSSSVPPASNANKTGHDHDRATWHTPRRPVRGRNSDGKPGVRGLANSEEQRDQKEEREQYEAPQWPHAQQQQQQQGQRQLFDRSRRDGITKMYTDMRRDGGGSGDGTVRSLRRSLGISPGHPWYPSNNLHLQAPGGQTSSAGSSATSSKTSSSSSSSGGYSSSPSWLRIRGASNPAAVAVSLLTSPPAIAAAAAARVLSADLDLLRACERGDVVSECTVRTATEAAAATATAAVAASKGSVYGKTTAAVGNGGGAVAAGVTTGLSATAVEGFKNGDSAWPRKQLLWPLLPEELMTLANHDGTRGFTTGSSSSAFKTSGRATARSGVRGSPQSSNSQARNAATECTEAGTYYAETLTAATVVLEAVSHAVLVDGELPLREAITRLRYVLRRHSSEDGSTPTGWTAAMRLIAVPDDVVQTVWDGLAAEAQHMSGAQLAAVLAAIGALALTPGRTVGRPAARALADRALELLAVGMPRRENPQPPPSSSTMNHNSTLRNSTLPEATFSLSGNHTQRLFPEGVTAAAAQPDGDPDAQNGPSPLPPPLAALLMLLLAAVLPVELSSRLVRWTLWGQLQVMLLTPAGSSSSQQQAADGNRALGLGLGLGPSGRGGPDGVDLTTARAQEQRGGLLPRGVAGRREREPGGQAAGTRGGASGRLSPVAVAALLVASKRFQVLITGTDVEEAALVQMCPTPLARPPAGAGRRADGGSNVAVRHSVIGPQQHQHHPRHQPQQQQQQPLQQPQQEDEDGELTPGQLATVLRCLTAQRVGLGIEVLQQMSARMSNKARGGALTPAEVMAVLAAFADQMYDPSRRDLAGLLGFIFIMIEQAAAQEADTVAVAQGSNQSCDVSVTDEGSTARHGTAVGSTASPYSLSYLATICGNIEEQLGRLRLEWAQPELVTAVREDLAAFAASGGSHPLVAVKAWRAFIRSPVRRGSPPLDPAELDAFIDEARRELLSWGELGESVLEQVLAVQGGEGVEAWAEGGAEEGEGGVEAFGVNVMRTPAEW